jgi:hypothetical protein
METIAGPPRPHLYLELDTFAPAADGGERLTQVVELLRTAVLAPVLEGAGSGAKAFFTMQPRVGSSTRQYELSAENWQLLLDRLAAGRVGELFVWFETYGTSTWTAEFELRERSEYTTGRAHRLAVRSSPDLLGGELSTVVQQRWVDLGKEAACALEAVTGYLTYDDRRSGTDSPYESRFTLQEGLLHAREFARGYYWGNFLGAEQVRRLGGFEQLRAAPVHVVERVCRDPEIVYLQLSEDLRTYSNDELRALRDFLRPVLRPVTNEWEYMGSKVRVLDEP